MICKTLAAVVNSREGDAGLRVHVASEPSGGAPMICSRLPAPPSDGNDEAGAANDFPQLLLVPLTLGVEKVALSSSGKRPPAPLVPPLHPRCYSLHQAPPT